MMSQACGRFELRFGLSTQPAQLPSGLQARARRLPGAGTLAHRAKRLSTLPNLARCAA